MEKSCTTCGKTEEESLGFYHKAISRSGYVSQCKVCIKARVKRYYHSHKSECALRVKRYQQLRPQDWKASQRKYYLKRQYNLTIDAYNKLLASQDGKCGICRQVCPKTLDVDHCHLTGEIRGLLCANCNTGLGHFGDNPDILWDAYLYLAMRQVRSK